MQVVLQRCLMAAAIVAIAILITACQSKAKPGPPAKAIDTRGADILWVPAHAKLRTAAPFGPVVIKSGRSVYIDNTADVYFDLDGDRKELTSELIAHFEERGWHRRGYEFANPGRATSFASGWVHRCACLITRDTIGNIRPRDQLFEWHGEWENDRHDLVVYDFFAESRRIGGGGSYRPSSVVDEILHKLGRSK